jgi:hypothetical protein
MLPRNFTFLLVMALPELIENKNILTSFILSVFCHLWALPIIVLKYMSDNFRLSNLFFRGEDGRQE